MKRSLTHAPSRIPALAVMACLLVVSGPVASAFPTFGRVALVGNEIVPDVVGPVDVGPPEVPVEPELTDAEIERFLSEGRVVEMQEIPTGISRPMKIKLELDGRTRKAAFKTIDVALQGITRFKRSAPEFNFKDSYVYDRAGYLLDRHLGLDMVPVVVLRTVNGQRGAVVDWVSDAVNENERLKQGLKPPDPARLIQQRAVMNLFDALILNTDRNLGNQLITPTDWKLHLIDHTRSFRLFKKLPESYLAGPASLPRGLLDKLESLDETTLRELLGDLLSRAQIRALLARRDRIVAKISEDRKTHGDALIFHD